MNISGRWYSETELQAYIVTLEHRLATVEDKHLSECRQISEYEQENRRLKELLAEAMKDVIGLENCSACAYNSGVCPAATDVCRFKWVHADEANELIGGKA